MNTVPSSTYFSAPPDWGWLITFYFFFGGLAGGCYFLAALIDLLGRPEDRPLARLGYYISFPCVVLSGLLLTLDLGRPERFWHMLIESNTFRPMFKYWSPMSIGSWALLIFGFLALVSFLERSRKTIVSTGGSGASPAGNFGVNCPVIGGIFGLYVAGYTGFCGRSPTVRSGPTLLFRYALHCLGGFDFGGIDDSPCASIQMDHARSCGARLHRHMDRWVGADVLIAVMISLGPVFGPG